jgi:hypothetical protein
MLQRSKTVEVAWGSSKDCGDSEIVMFRPTQSIFREDQLEPMGTCGAEECYN